MEIIGAFSKVPLELASLSVATKIKCLTHLFCQVSENLTTHFGN
jgi:hypothetical protein